MSQSTYNPAFLNLSDIELRALIKAEPGNAAAIAELKYRTECC